MLNVDDSAFFYIQILREINFSQDRSPKNAIFFAISEALNFWFGSIHPSENSKIHEVSKFRATKCVKISIFGPLNSTKLISRKIRVAGNFWNFHTVVKSPMPKMCLYRIHCPKWVCVFPLPKMGLCISTAQNGSTVYLLG